MLPVGFEPTISAGERQGRSPAEIVAEDEPDLFEVYKLEVGQFLTCSCSLLRQQ